MTVAPRHVLALLLAGVVVLAGILGYVLLVRSPTGPGSGSPGAAVCPSASDPNGLGNWTTYHRDGSRSGLEPVPGIRSAHPIWSSPPAVDGPIYAEPLVCGNVVYVATENDSVYAFNSTSGALLWRTHLGDPVPGSSLPCGDIDPSGITGTPVIDAANRTLYAVAFVAPSQHVLFGLRLSDGAVLSQVTVDPPGADPTVEQERGALAFDRGNVYVPFGGLDGDCGDYHGWVVGVPTDGSGGLLTYEVPTSREGGIWSPAGITVAANGDLLVATGNGASDTAYDSGDSVIELSPRLAVLSYFAPSNWAELNSGDTDLGSVAPTMLPDGEVFQIGKEGVGYLLSGTDLGGIGGELYNASVCGGAYGGTARFGMSVLVPCVDGLVDLSAGPAHFSLVWRTSGFHADPPIVTGNITWAVDASSATLLGFNLSNGHTVFSFPLGAVSSFATPAAGVDTLYVGAGSSLYALGWA